MALFNASEGEKQAGTWFRRGVDHDKPVRVQLRPIPAHVDRDIRRKVFGSVKNRRKGQSWAKEMDLGEELTRTRAAYALIDTDNFFVGLLDDPAAKAYGELLQAPQAKKGEELSLDGKWTDEVKRRFLTDFGSFAAWVSNKADSLTEEEVDEEAEATEAF
jgi:hypothetical protein